MSEVKTVEIEVSNRAVNLPVLGDVSRGSSAKLQIPQLGEPNGDPTEDMEAVFGLCEDVEELFQAVNEGIVSVRRSKWFAENAIESVDGSALSTLRNLIKTYESMGIDPETAVKTAVKVPNIYAACVLDGIDCSAALTAEEKAALDANVEANKKVVLDQRAKIAEAKAKSKRGRPKKND